MLEVIGWIGSFCFAICGIPQAIKSFKDKHSDGLDWNFLLLWFTGELSMIIYTIQFNSLQLLVNYVFNFLCLLVILYYKIISETVNAKNQKTETSL